MSGTLPCSHGDQFHRRGESQQKTSISVIKELCVTMLTRGTVPGFIICIQSNIYHLMIMLEYAKYIFSQEMIIPMFTLDKGNVR